MEKKAATSLDKVNERFRSKGCQLKGNVGPNKNRKEDRSGFLFSISHWTFLKYNLFLTVIKDCPVRLWIRRQMCNNKHRLFGSNDIYSSKIESGLVLFTVR